MDVRKNAAVEEPTDLRQTAATAQEAEATKRATLEMCVTGSKSGIHWFPLALRGSSPGT